MGPVDKANYSGIIADGIMAQRKLNGDKDIYTAVTSRSDLKKMVERGKRAEEYCRAHPDLAGCIERGHQIGDS